MTQKSTQNGASEESGTFPACCKDAAEKMTGCGPVMEKMMAHCGPMMEKMMGSFGAKTSEDESSARCTKPEDSAAV